VWQQLDQSLIKKIKVKMEQELAKKELETIQYWLEEIKKVYNRYRDITTLQNALKELEGRMQNRTRAIKEKL
jgi:hypothetical protein